MDSSRLQPIQGRTGPLGYYWFLTFDHVPELHALTRFCQQAIDRTYFAATPVDGLHLTLDRIAYDGASTPEQLESIATAAQRACQDLTPFTLKIERITNLRGAIGFVASPEKRVRTLRSALRAATLSALPDAPVKGSSSLPHVTIAYPMFEGLSAEAAAAVQRMLTSSGVEIAVTQVGMVALERRRFLYTWRLVALISLGIGTFSKFP